MASIASTPSGTRINWEDSRQFRNAAVAVFQLRAQGSSEQKRRSLKRSSKTLKNGKLAVTAVFDTFHVVSCEAIFLSPKTGQPCADCTITQTKASQRFLRVGRASSASQMLTDGGYNLTFLTFTRSSETLYACVCSIRFSSS